MYPGATQLAVIPRGPTWADRPAVHAWTAAFATPYDDPAYSAPIDPTVMIDPPGGISRRAAVTTSTVEMRLASRLARHPLATSSSPGSPSDSDPAGRSKSVLPPAIATMTSTGPVWRNSSSTARVSATSHTT